MAGEGMQPEGEIVARFESFVQHRQLSIGLPPAAGLYSIVRPGINFSQ